MSRPLLKAKKGYWHLDPETLGPISYNRPQFAIVRYAISCAGCEQEILVRLSVHPSEGCQVLFSVSKWKDLRSPGECRVELISLKLRVEFDDCKMLGPDTSKIYPNVVTVALNVPLKPTARDLRQVEEPRTQCCGMLRERMPSKWPGACP